VFGILSGAVKKEAAWKGVCAFFWRQMQDGVPSIVETEFSLVRFEGDGPRARKVYEGMKPLTADDVAECVRWVCSLPAHVDVDEIVVRPRDQATATEVHRRLPEGEKP